MMDWSSDVGSADLARDAVPLVQSRRDLARCGKGLRETQPLVTLDQKGRVAMLGTEKGDIVGQVRRGVGDEGQRPAGPFDGPNLDRASRPRNQVISGFQAQIERGCHPISHIGRPQCRERLCQYVYISWGAV